MISHSPPIFSHSPPVSFLSELNYNSQNLPYNEEGKTKFFLPQMLKFQSRNANNNNNNVNTNITTNRCRGSRAAGLGLERMATAPELTTYPPKSCLIRRHNSKSKALDIQNNENVNSRSRKKVIFADDQGLSLIEVRVMSEPSNVPPYWSMKFLEQITQGLVSPHPADTWTVDFKQPASDYLTFRQKIESNFVSLENVIVKDDESLILGTVKVKNISFNKEVIVRVTWDNWKSQQDIFCTFSRIYSPTAAHVVFDTFAFKITLPPSSKKLEFCICFRANGVEHWDNNENKNYSVSKRSPFYYQSLAPYEKSHRSSNPITITNKYSLSSNDIKNHSEKQFITNNNNNSNHIMNNNYRNDSTSPYW